MKPRYSLTETRLLNLNQQRARSSLAFGGKSANLGEVMFARLPGIVVPDGFTIPFHYYDEFINRNKLDGHLRTAERQKFVHDPAYRRESWSNYGSRSRALNSIRRCGRRCCKKWRASMPAKVYSCAVLRTEDLPNFSGAGLYTTVPNVRGDQELIDAIRKVWASLWNFEAYEARERAGVDHSKIFMAVLLQEGINSESSGVMISTDPFDTENKAAIYISAKQAGNQSGRRSANRRADHLSAANECGAGVDAFRGRQPPDVDEKAAVVPITGDRVVLTDDVIRRLVRAALDIKRVFGNRDQDIEWAYMKGQIYIVQSRPFIPGS